MQSEQGTDRIDNRVKRIVHAIRERKLAFVEDRETAQEIAENMRAYSLCGRISQRFDASEGE